MKNYILNKIILLIWLGVSAMPMFALTKNAPAQAGGAVNQVVRVGIVPVKTGKVGDGMNAQELAGAVQSSLTEYLKTPKLEIVQLESQSAEALNAEVKEKGCQYVVYATISHKKGGGGFGMLKTLAPVLVTAIPVVGVVGMIAATAASTAVTTAASTKVKSKDELTLDVKVDAADGKNALTKQYKGKAKSGGEDIISPLIEQSAQNILDAVTK